MNQETCVHVVLAADERFAMPLAVTVRSFLIQLRAGATSSVSVLDGGISPESKRRVEASVEDLGHAVEWNWLPIPNDRLHSLEVSGHVSVATYYRIFLASLLPAEIRRVIYLDCDTLVRDDLTKLYQETLGNHTCAAVQDISAPFMASRMCSEVDDRWVHYLAATRPIPNFEDFGFVAKDPYFNAGVLLIDVERWRSRDIEAKLLQCIQQHRADRLWWDQYALNAVLHGDWIALDAGWNQTSHTYTLPMWRDSFLDEATFDRVKLNPSIVHFSSATKPWHARCRHPFAKEYEAVLDQTSWKGVRPSWRDWMRETAINTHDQSRRFLGTTLSHLLGKSNKPRHLG